MWRRRNCYLLLKALAHITVFFFITACSGGELSETESFFTFMRAIDPQNVLRISWNGIVPHPCSYRWRGVKCSFQPPAVTQIRLDRQNFTGTIDADSLCGLQHLQVLSLAKNHIQGNIPHSILNCRSLTYLNLSSNFLTGRVPVPLFKLKYLRTLDISNNYLTVIIPRPELEFKHLNHYSMKHSAVKMYNLQKLAIVADSVALNSTDAGSVEHPADPSNGSKPGSGKRKWYDKAIYVVPLAFGIVFLSVLGYFVNKRFSDSAKEREILKSLAHSPQKTPPPVPQEDLKPKERCSELVFFVEEKERFGLDDLFEATADLQSQTPSSSLYKVKLEPLISEYGFSTFLDPKRVWSFSSNGYTAPEKILSEQGDVFSFGIIMLELLTGKTVEKSGIDLPKWVRSIVREEWTGEVFDKEFNHSARQYAFPLLNISLKCVSKSPEERPSMGEVMEKIEEVVNANEEFTISSMGSILSSPPEWCILHSVIPETWDTPGSNY
ncbi:probable leucine-rich repeat receptor-like protein kinase IMK3 [Populus nigra]|uniref:probable leucine-rich repeat receptor-like protein kinase IMK3 n=1 Tax=Populus nigra TaxID=3691 RepID=UPI002B269426|nr:probable leucine-rich repeat receptor-like protein kinase IMK3 [Populus nigra]